MGAGPLVQGRPSWLIRVENSKLEPAGVGRQVRVITRVLRASSLCMWVFLCGFKTDITTVFARAVPANVPQRIAPTHIVLVFLS